MHRRDMLARVLRIEADKIANLLAFHINDIERLALAYPEASALIGRDRNFLNDNGVSHVTFTCLKCLVNEHRDGPDRGAGAFADFERESKVQKAFLSDFIEIA